VRQDDCQLTRQLVNQSVTSFPGGPNRDSKNNRDQFILLYGIMASGTVVLMTLLLYIAGQMARACSGMRCLKDKVGEFSLSHGLTGIS